MLNLIEIYTSITQELRGFVDKTPTREVGPGTGVLVGHCFGYVLHVMNQILYTSTLLMARIFIEAAKHNN